MIEIESLDIEGRGVGHLQNPDGSKGKTIFVDGALPGERVSFQSFRKKPKWEAANVVDVLRESVLRVEPKCAHFGVCGGCAMQHLDASAQVAIKQRVLEDNLKHIGKVVPETLLRPIHGPNWGYRFRARISVRFVAKKGGVLVGFHERKSSFICDMRSCEILPAHVSAMLMPLRKLIESLSITDRVPQIELAVGAGEERTITALVLRIMAPLTPHDESELKAFADRYQVQWWLQPAGPDSAYPFYPSDAQLHYALPEFGIKIPFKPTDFTQVNHQINQVLVARALRLLEVRFGERVADFFCGLGNFSLPLATQARQVIGFEGSAALIERAQQNAIFNGLHEKAGFSYRNLFDISTDELRAMGKFDRYLVDPPREGADALCQALSQLENGEKPRRIVYVSCNPSTLARDAATLVHTGSYQLKQAGVINMFPHTAHVESIAVFDLKNAEDRVPTPSTPSLIGE